MTQRELFAQATQDTPAGLNYSAGFLSAAEETQLLAVIGELPFREAQYKEWHARRRIVSFGGRYDFTQQQLH